MIDAIIQRVVDEALREMGIDDSDEGAGVLCLTYMLLIGMMLARSAGEVITAHVSLAHEFVQVFLCEIGAPRVEVEVEAELRQHVLREWAKYGKKKKADREDKLAWVCPICGHFQEDGMHCSTCLHKPPWGCDCSDCHDRAMEREQDGEYFDEGDYP